MKIAKNVRLLRAINQRIIILPIIKQGIRARKIIRRGMILLNRSEIIVITMAKTSLDRGSKL
jgi:hypothetical protein